MYMGKSAVTFNIPGSGVNYVSINNLTGIEVANGNVAGYAEAIKKLAADKSLREKYGNAARERVKSMFTEKVFTDKLNSIIKSL